MSKKKKFVEAITSIDDDFAKWYTDIVTKAELIDYSSVKGCMILRPYGYAIWENIQKELDEKLKETGHENVYMPLLIPESLFQKEKDHIEGFAPEVAVVTHGGSEELNERLIIRPTSETLFCEHYSKVIQSYNDLPKKYNQWCSVVRWEKTTRPFLRTTEFLWQEGHTAHATSEEAQEETLLILELYAKFLEDFLAIPVIKGQKTEKEKFAGAKATYTIESMMHDGKALQSGTSHHFGNNFSKPFNITYTDKNSQQQYVHQTSWGVTTRLIGALIMVHGDNHGLVLPPKVAPTQVMIIPIRQKDENVIRKVNDLKDSLSQICRVKMDASDKSPGWKFNEYEMKGIPLRIELGPRDIENNQAVLVRRDTKEKTVVSLENIEEAVMNILDDIQKNLYKKALENRENKTYFAKTFDEMKQISDEKSGFINAMWCGKSECEEKIKQECGLTSRCIPMKQESISTTCICCGEEAKKLVTWGKAY